MGETEKELYPGHAKELARKAKRDKGISLASKNPLPGHLLDAFTALPTAIAGLTVRPLVHYDFVMLKQLGSPLLAQAEKGVRTPFTDQQAYEMVFQFTRPPKLVAAELRKGREEFAGLAVEEIGMAIGPVEVALLVKAVEREFVRAFSTVIKYEPKAVEDGTVFTRPLADQMTVSAGGSTTSVD